MDKSLQLDPGNEQALLTQARELAGDYLSNLSAIRAFPDASAIEGLNALRRPWTDQGTPAHDVIAELNQYAAPGTVASTGGRYFGFVMGGCLPVSLAANWLAGTWDQNAGRWAMSPAAATLEETSAEWLLDALDLPRQSAVGFVTGATMANFSAMGCARSALLKRAGWDLKKNGARNAPPMRVIASAEQHSTVLKGLTMLGIGHSEIDFLPTDDQGRINPERLPDIDDRTLILLQAGNLNSGAFDPFIELCQWAKQANAWVHVDGAFGLWARSSRLTKPLTEGIELADSWAVDCHKWLNVPYDSAVYVCRHPQAVQDVFGVDAPYLTGHPHREPSNFTPELSRRARGIEIWAALRYLGRQGLEQLIDQSCRQARRFAEGLSKGGYRILNDVVLNQVAAALDTDELTMQALRRIQDGGICWLGPTHWKGRAAMRVSVSSWRTTDEDVERSIRAMVTAKSA